MLRLCFTKMSELSELGLLHSALSGGARKEETKGGGNNVGDCKEGERSGGSGAGGCCGTIII